MSESWGFSPESVNFQPEQVKNENGGEAEDMENGVLDRPASIEDIGKFKDAIEEEIAEKAVGVGIETKEDLAGMVDLLKLDLGYFDNLDREDIGSRDTDAPAWTGRDLECMKDNVQEALAECRRNGDELKLEPNADLMTRVTDFLEKHHDTISLSQFALLAFSYESIILQDLSEKGRVNVKIKDYYVPLETMLNNTKIAEKMNEFGASDVDHHNFGQYYFSNRDIFEDDGTKFSFEVYRGLPQAEENDNAIGINRLIEEEKYVQRIYLLPIDVDGGKLNKFNVDLKNNVGISLRGEDNGCSFEEFSENRAQIAHYLAEDLGVKEGKIAENIDGFIGYDATNVLLVELDDFRIDSHVQKSENFEALKSYEKELAADEGHAMFREQFLQVLKDNNYDIDQIKDMAETNPEAAIRIILDVIAESIDYDMEQQEFDGQEWHNRCEESGKVSLQALQTGKANCWAWMVVCINAKVVLEEEGVPNLDKVAFFPAISSEVEHVWVAMATENSAGGVDCTCADPTLDGVRGNNAVDTIRGHSYAVSDSEVCEAALAGVRNVQDLYKLQEAFDVLQYDPYLGESNLIEVKGGESGVADAGEPMLERIMDKISELRRTKRVG